MHKPLGQPTMGRYPCTHLCYPWNQVPMDWWVWVRGGFGMGWCCDIHGFTHVLPYGHIILVIILQAWDGRGCCLEWQERRPTRDSVWVHMPSWQSNQACGGSIAGIVVTSSLVQWNLKWGRVIMPALCSSSSFERAQITCFATVHKAWMVSVLMLKASWCVNLSRGAVSWRILTLSIT